MSARSRSTAVRRAAPGTDGASAPTGSRLLAALARVAPADAAWLDTQLEAVTLELGEMLAAADEPYRHIYFPETAVVSVINRMSDGGAAEVGTIGNEGMAGIASYLEAAPSRSESVVQIAGTAFRVPVATFLRGMRERPLMLRLLNRYTLAYLAQVEQTAACNRLHGIEVRCARWLLMTHDRIGQPAEFPLTQEYLAIMLGVRRSGVSVAAGSLRDAGLIRYSRGVIRVSDRDGLEHAACECYGVVRRHFDRLLD
jgi:CRP-like cAMP-binding protein